MKTVKAISPDELTLEEKIPWYIVEAVNDLIRSKYKPNGSSFTIKQDAILELAFEKYNNTEDFENFSQFKRRIFDNHQLDFEDLYRKNGWKVVYDKPGYNESYDAYFEFKRADKKSQ